MEIISKSRELSKMEQYKLTRGNSTNAKDAVGTTIHPDAWCTYQEVNARGENVEILAILDHDGSVYSTCTDSVESYTARAQAAQANGTELYEAIMNFADSAKVYLENKN